MNTGANQKEIIEEDKELTNEQKEVAESAIEGVKGYINADYVDPYYDGTKGAEGFAVGFRTFQIFEKAEERVKYIKANKIKREVTKISEKSISINGDTATVELVVSLSTYKNGEGKQEILEIKTNLINMGGGVWYISNMDPIIYP